jgi:hypothetical protein
MILELPPRLTSPRTLSGLSQRRPRLEKDGETELFSLSGVTFGSIASHPSPGGESGRRCPGGGATISSIHVLENGARGRWSASTPSSTPNRCEISLAVIDLGTRWAAFTGLSGSI